MNKRDFRKLFEYKKRELEEMVALISIEEMEKNMVETFLVFGDRCTLFRISAKTGIFELIQGLPLGQHQLGFRDSLTRHPDIAETVRDKEIFFIRDTRQSFLTHYFSKLIEQYNINGILYVPVLLDGEEAKWVVVIDACGSRQFSLGDDEFCLCLEELFSYYLYFKELEKECRLFGSFSRDFPWQKFLSMRHGNQIVHSSLYQKVVP